MEIESPVSRGKKTGQWQHIPQPQPTASFWHLFAHEKRFKTKLRRGFQLAQTLEIISNEISQNRFLLANVTHILSVLVDNDVFARGIIWQDLPRIKWTVIEAFETNSYSYCNVCYVAFRISAGDCRSCSNLGTLLQMCKLQTLAQSKPLLQLNSYFGGASYSSGSCVETNCNRVGTAVGMSNKQKWKSCKETWRQLPRNKICRDNAKKLRHETCKQIGPQKAEAWASALVMIYRKARTKIQARNSNALKGFKGNIAAKWALKVGAKERKALEKKWQSNMKETWERQVNKQHLVTSFDPLALNSKYML